MILLDQMPALFTVVRTARTFDHMVTCGCMSEKQDTSKNALLPDNATHGKGSVRSLGLVRFWSVLNYLSPSGEAWGQALK